MTGTVVPASWERLLRARGRRRPVATVSAAAMGLGTCPALLLGYLGPQMRADFHLSRSALGLLIGIFYAMTGAASVGAAVIAEPLGERRCVVADQALVACCLLCLVATRSPLVLGVAVALSGAGYALTNAGTSMAVAAAAPVGQAGLDLTVKTAGVPLMATLLAMAGAAAGSGVGWPALAISLAAASGVTAAAAALVLPSHGSRAGVGASHTPANSATGRLTRGFVLLPIAAFLFIGGSQPLLSWLVLTLTDAGLAPRTAGLVSAAGSGFGVVAMLAISRLSDMVGPGRRALVAAGLAALSASGVLVLWRGSNGPLPLVVLGAVAGLVGNLAGAALLHAVVVDRVPWAVGRAIGIMSAGYFAGALVAPWAFGATADATGSYQLSWGLSFSALALGSGCFLAAQFWLPVPVSSTGPAPALGSLAGANDCGEA